MRVVSACSLLLLAAAFAACPSTRQAGGDGDGGGGGGGGGDVCDVAGVEVAVPADVGSKGAGEAPDLSCIGNPVAVGASSPLTLEGCVDIFGLGASARAGTEVAIFAADVDPKGGAPLATATVAVAVASSALRGTCTNSGLECGPTRSCVEFNSDGDVVRDEGLCDCQAGPDADAPACRALDCESEGFYRLDGTVPSNTPLVMRITHPTDATVVDTYIWGLVLIDTLAVDGVFTYEAALIYSSTYSSIPTLSGRQIEGNQNLGDGLGRGVIAGEIHDCTDTIVGNAVVGMSDFDSTMKVVYFDGADSPNPDPVRFSTADDGLYAILNVVPDVEQTVVAGVRDPACTGDDCTCLSLGTRTVKAYADSVSIVTLRGDFPVQQ
jgi:hypothetical protein